MKVKALLALLSVTLLSNKVACDSYDQDLGKQLFYYSAAAYCEELSLIAWACGPACNKIKGLDSITMITDILLSVQGFVAYNSQTQSIYVVFRGTIGNINTVEDIDFFKM